MLRLNVPVNNFQSYRDGAIASWVINQYFRGVKCLAQGHNTAAVGLEPRTSRSGVRHSTTEPPRSPTKESRVHIRFFFFVFFFFVFCCCCCFCCCFFCFCCCFNPKEFIRISCIEAKCWKIAFYLQVDHTQ